jgi:diguanylate cyclase
VSHERNHPVGATNMRRFRSRFVTWAAVVGVVLCLLAVLLDWHVARSWYLWAYVLPLPVLLVAGLARGVLINALVYAGVCAALFMGTWPIEPPELRWDIALSLLGLNAVAALYEYVRAEHASTLHHVMSTDGLTELWNRRTFEAVLQSEVTRAQRYERPLTLLLFDIDEFKAVNDTHGHPAGDRVLKELAELVSDTVRTSDHVARLGGDEFAIVTPETAMEYDDEPGAETLARRLRDRVAEHDFGVDIQIQISIGVAQLSAQDTMETFYARADEALYESKRASQNLVCFKPGDL